WPTLSVWPTLLAWHWRCDHEGLKCRQYRQGADKWRVSNGPAYAISQDPCDVCRPIAYSGETSPRLARRAPQLAPAATSLPEATTRRLRHQGLQRPRSRNCTDGRVAVQAQHLRPSAA